MDRQNSGENSFQPGPGVIIGIVLASVFVVALLIAIVCLHFRKRSSKLKHAQAATAKHHLDSLNSGIMTSQDEWLVTYEPSETGGVEEPLPVNHTLTASRGGTLRLNIERQQDSSASSLVSFRGSIPDKQTRFAASEPPVTQTSKPVLTLPPRMHMFVGRTLTVSGVPSGAAPKSRPRLYERNTPQNSPRSAAADQEGDNWSFHSSASATLPPPAAVGVNDVAESNNIHSGPAVVRNGPAMRGILKNSRANGSAARTWGPASARVVTSSAHERRKEYSNGAVLSLTPRRLWKYYFAGKKNPVMNPV